jgi:hypothetical protein
MTMTSPEPPSTPPTGQGMNAAYERPLARRVRVLAAVFGSLSIAMGGIWVVASVWAFGQGRREEAGLYLLLATCFSLGWQMIRAARTGRDIT